MIRKYFAGLLIIFSICSCKVKPTEPQHRDILDKLRSLPGLVVTEIDPHYRYPRAFQIDMLQYVDHHSSSDQAFLQRVYLSHTDETKPMVFAPSGYEAVPESNQEIARVLGANCIAVTHRFFEGSKPNPPDWKYLTVEQAAADHHCIVTLFKRIYSGIWISSGVSKSGETVLHHRRFYPNDVRATIAYVAPILFDPHDPRVLSFLDNVGDEDCRNRIKQFQRRLLKKRDVIMPYLQQYFQQANLTVSMDMNDVFEYAVIDYAFLFWQYHDLDCSVIPDPGAPVEAMFNHFEEVSRLTRFSDKNISFYEPYYYQCMTEIGGAAFWVDHLRDLLLYVKEPTNGDFAPKNVQCVYNPGVVPDILHWLQTEGNNIIYIYGGIDPWTAGAIELTGQTNALKIIQEGGDHRLKIADLDDPNVVYATLEQWLGIPVRPTGKALKFESDLGESWPPRCSPPAALR